MNFLLIIFFSTFNIIFNQGPQACGLLETASFTCGLETNQKQKSYVKISQSDANQNLKKEQCHSYPAQNGHKCCYLRYRITAQCKDNSKGWIHTDGDVTLTECWLFKNEDIINDQIYETQERFMDSYYLYEVENNKNNYIKRACLPEVNKVYEIDCKSKYLKNILFLFFLIIF